MPMLNLLLEILLPLKVKTWKSHQSRWASLKRENKIELNWENKWSTVSLMVVDLEVLSRKQWPLEMHQRPKESNLVWQTLLMLTIRTEGHKEAGPMVSYQLPCSSRWLPRRPTVNTAGVRR